MERSRDPVEEVFPLVARLAKVKSDIKKFVDEASAQVIEMEQIVSSLNNKRSASPSPETRKRFKADLQFPFMKDGFIEVRFKVWSML